MLHVKDFKKANTLARTEVETLLKRNSFFFLVVAERLKEAPART